MTAGWFNCEQDPLELQRSLCAQREQVVDHPQPLVVYQWRADVREEPHFECLHSKCELLLNFWIGS